MATINQKIADFKDRVQQDWGTEETAAAWQKYHGRMREQMAGVTAALVEAADVRPGMDVLDLASGTGEPSLSLAQKVAPGGTITATDFNPYMLKALMENAHTDGIENIVTKTCDAHELPFEDSSFDRVTSRFGVMFLGELHKALQEFQRVLVPGGRVAFLAWGPPAPGTYFGTAVVPYMKRMPDKPDPDGPGPMRFAEPGKLKRVVEEAGYREVTETIQTLAAPWVGTPEELLKCLFELAAPFRNVAASLSPEDRKAADAEAIANMHAVFDGQKTNVTAPIVIVTGIRG